MACELVTAAVPEFILGGGGYCGMCGGRKTVAPITDCARKSVCSAHFTRMNKMRYRLWLSGM